MRRFVDAREQKRRRLCSSDHVCFTDTDGDRIRFVARNHQLLEWLNGEAHLHPVTACHLYEDTITDEGGVCTVPAADHVRVFGFLRKHRHCVATFTDGIPWPPQYQTLNDETVAAVARRFGVDAGRLLRENDGRYADLTLTARLQAGTTLIVSEVDAARVLEENRANTAKKCDHDYEDIVGGTILLDHGDVYRGSGEGTIEYADGGTYEGGYAGGRPDGVGTMQYGDGVVYEQGDCYRGEWKGGRHDGRGHMVYANGTVYHGDWRDGEAHGVGVMTYADGTADEGRWWRGEYHGDAARVAGPTLHAQLRLQRQQQQQRRHQARLHAAQHAAQHAARRSRFV